MKNYFSLIVSLFFIFTQLSAQSWQWAIGEGTSNEDELWEIASFPGSNYFYATGFVSDSIKIGRTWFTKPTGPLPGRDLFIAKFHISGSLVWGKMLGTPRGKERAYSIAVDSADNFFVSGAFQDTLDLGGISLTGTFSPLNNQYHAFIAKFSSDGNALWAMGGISGTYFRPHYLDKLILDQDGNLYGIGTGPINAFGTNFPLIGEDLVVKLDGTNGQVLWAKAFESILDPMYITSIVDHLMGLGIDKSNNLYVTGSSTVPGLGGIGFTFQGHDTIPYTGTDKEYLFIAKLTPDSGKVDWLKHMSITRYGDSHGIAPSVKKEGVYIDFLFRDTITFYPSMDTFQVKPNATGGILLEIQADGLFAWKKKSQYPGHTSYPFEKMKTVRNYCYVGGRVHWANGIFKDSVFLPGVPNGISAPYIGAFDSTGTMQWAAQALTTGKMWNTGLLVKNNQIILAGYYEPDSIFFGPFGFPHYGDRDIYLASYTNPTYEPPIPLNKIEGQIFHEANSNCQKDSLESPYINAILKSTPGPRYSATDGQGNYTLYADTGTTKIRLLPRNWPFFQAKPVCPQPRFSHYLHFDSLGNDTSGIDFGAQFDTLCQGHRLWVAVTPRRGRICTKGSTYIHYENMGQDSAQLVKVVVQYPQALIPLSSNIPWTTTSSGKMEFDLGSVGPGVQGQLIIQDSILCSVGIGATQCIEATIFPPSPCTPINPTWTGAEIEVKGICLGKDQVLFTIKNIGVGNMGDSTAFRISFDDTVRLIGKIKLNLGDSVLYQISSKGKTVRMEIDQELFHPHNPWVSSSVENCASGTQAISTGYVMNFPQQYPQAATTTACFQVTGSYDPNDKQGAPIGWGPQHGISKESRLTYRIRFQNTGNDTAFKVVLVDTLPQELDISTLLIEGASHPFSWQLTGVGRPVLNFSFDPIELPDSTTNVLASQGFVQFSINPYDTLAEGSRIENFAEIFFDYNPPIITPISFHTIADSIPIRLDPSLFINCTDSIAVLAGKDSTFCSSSPSDTFLLQGNGHGPGFFRWRALAGTPILSKPFNLQTAVYQLNQGVNEFEISSSLCLQEVKDTVIIFNALAPSKPLPIASGPLNFCEPDSVQIVSGSAFSGYFWSNGDTTNHISIKKSGNFTLRIANSQGCLSPVSDTIQVKAYPIPVKAQLNYLQDTVLCIGDSIQLSMLAQGNHSYLWQNRSRLQALNIKSNGIYQGQYISSFGCKGPISDSIRIDFQQPSKPVITADTTTILCEGDTAIIQVSALNNHQYFWSTGQRQSQISVLKNSVLTAQLVDSIGCKSEWADSFYMNFSPVPPPPQISPIGYIEACEGDSIVLSASGPYSHWLWNTGDPTAGISVKKSGIYTLKGKINNGCTSLWADSVHVLFAPFPPQPMMMVTPTVINALNTPNGIILQWHDLSGPIVGANGQAFFPNKSGFYFLELIQPIGWCTTFSDTVNFLFTNINPVQDPIWRISPQPAKRHLSIEGPLRAGMNISLVSTNGKSLQAWEIEKNTSTTLLHLDPFPAGLYLIRIRHKSQHWVQKVLIE